MPIVDSPVPPRGQALLCADCRRRGVPFDGGDELEPPAAVRALFDLDVEDAFEPPYRISGGRHPSG